MTARQILDAFSETLMQDQRILSVRARELLTSLLQAASNGNSAVTVAIGEGVFHQLCCPYQLSKGK